MGGYMWAAARYLPTLLVAYKWSPERRLQMQSCRRLHAIRIAGHVTQWGIMVVVDMHGRGSCFRCGKPSDGVTYISRASVLVNVSPHGLSATFMPDSCQLSTQQGRQSRRGT